MSATGTAVLLEFNTWQSLEIYMKLVYYSNYPMNIYFQVQFLKLKCTENTKNTIKNALKSEIKKKVLLLKKAILPRTKKMPGAKEKYYRDPESRRQCRKRKYQENSEQQKEYQKGNIRKTLSQKKSMKKINSRKILNKK